MPTLHCSHCSAPHYPQPSPALAGTCRNLHPPALFSGTHTQVASGVQGSGVDDELVLHGVEQAGLGAGAGNL